MKQSFCSIISYSHVGYILALMDSINQWQVVPTDFHVWVIDKKNMPFPAAHLNLYWHDIDELMDVGIVAKYRQSESKLRWSLKPVLIKNLLQQLEYQKVIYVDWDLFFFDTYQFLFDYLDRYNVLLTPHHRATNPSIASMSFLYNLKHGFFNAGFVGASYGGIPALNWWQAAVMFACESSEQLGLHDDQRYLDLIPLQFKNVLIVRHSGVNLSEWHYHPSLELIDGVLHINHQPIVCVHFTDYAIFVFENAHQVPEFYEWRAMSRLCASYKESVSQYDSHTDHLKNRWQLRAEQFFGAYRELLSRYVDLEARYHVLMEQKNL
jgi:hypothetical protein